MPTTSSSSTITSVSTSATLHSLAGDSSSPLTNFGLDEGTLLASSSCSSANENPKSQIKENPLDGEKQEAEVKEEEQEEEILIKLSPLPSPAVVGEPNPKTQLMKSATIISRHSSQVPRQSSVANIVQQTNKLPASANKKTVANHSKQVFLGSAIIKSTSDGEQRLDQPMVAIKTPDDPYSTIKSNTVTNKPAPNVMLYAPTNRNNTKLPLVINHASAGPAKVQPSHSELNPIPSHSSQLISSSSVTQTQTKPSSSLSSSPTSSSFSSQSPTATPSSRTNCNNHSNRNKQPHQTLSTKTNIVATNCNSASEASAGNFLNEAHRQFGKHQTAGSDCDLSRSLASTGNGTRSTLTISSNTGAAPNAGHVVAARLMDMGKKLLDATREGKTDQVRQLVVSSGAPFTSDWLGTTALHIAAQHGHAEIAQILLRGGVNRDARTKLDRTALHLAAQVGCVEVVNLLLINGSDVNARDMLKMTPLHWAVERGHAQAAERLLINGADISARSKFQLTPIDIAKSSDCYEIIELFKKLTNDGTNHIVPSGVGLDSGELQRESYDNYHLALDECNIAANNKRASLSDADEPCIDLVELEWSTFKFEPDFFLSNDEDEEDDYDDERDGREPKVEHLMKVVEELQKENRQLKQKVQQLSTNSQ